MWQKFYSHNAGLFVRGYNGIKAQVACKLAAGMVVWVVVGMVGVGKRGAGSSFQSLYVYRQEEEDEEEERRGVGEQAAWRHEGFLSITTHPVLP